MSPSDNKPLRQLAAEKLHGKGANPSQLGDPISMKAETSENTRAENDDRDMPRSVRTPPPSSGGSLEVKKLQSGHHVRGMKTKETEQGTAPKPRKSVKGDPTSIKADLRLYDQKDGGAGQSGKAKGSKL
ncbi:hypothetical protein B0T22DRAFT_442533 [Podospora appendiculata]|uniref:Uncharacterized protein n=1 Tax=Podospora appendiculata TaxID=314037 RepID=A0AAE1CA84_9PEZI|nr:hypothetical protein B0T22DRAFT_442533 [Podospora appendiculata]